MPSSIALLAFEFSAPSLKTRPGQIVYRYRLEGYESDWRMSRETRVEYSDLPRKVYTFQVFAVDRDLTYSESPAQVVVDVHLPYAQILWGVSLILAILLAIWLGLRLVNRDRGLRASNAELLQKTRDLKEANSKVEKANRTKSAFLANMSHELRTPMNAILGFAELLLSNRENNLTERQQRNVGTIHRNAGNLLELINELLDLSKIEAGRMETLSERFEIQEVIQESLVVAEPLLRGKPVDVKVTYSDEHLVVETDRAKVVQIVVNLLSNAAKFTERGRVDIDVSTSGSHFSLVVRDTGVGIPSEKLESIFREFSQVSEKSVPGVAGTGLGLAIAERLCRLLGGTISVVSTLDEGSTFTVSLPRTLPPDTATKFEAAAPVELVANG